MLTCPSDGRAPDAPRKLKALALYGETDGSLNAEGLPIRTYRWIDRIPQGLTAIVGCLVVERPGERAAAPSPVANH